MSGNSAPTIDELRKEAESIGLTKIEDIRQYITERQTFFRDERIAKRQEAAEEREAAANAAAAQAKERQAIREAEERQAIRDHELALATARVENSTGSSIGSVNSIQYAAPRLPAYKEGDDITDYLIVFESVAELLHIPRGNWAIHLGPLLSGKAVKIYTTIDSAARGDYDCLKRSLLDGFGKTVDSYRRDFKSLRPKNEDTGRQFAVQLGRLFDLWINASKIDHTYKELFDFCIRDQFMNAINPEARTYIRDHRAKTFDDTMELYDNWTANHNYPNQKSVGNYSTRRRFDDTAKRNSVMPKYDRNTRPKDSSQMQCYHCREWGHISTNCPRLKDDSSIPDRVQLIGEDVSHDPEQEADVKEDTGEQVLFTFDDTQPRKFMSTGYLNGQSVPAVWRDTGCSCVMVSDKAISNYKIDPNKPLVTVYDYLGRSSKFPKCKVYLKCNYYEGFVDAVIAPLKFCDVLVGNIPGVKDPDLSHSCQIVTRSKQRINIHPLILPEIKGSILSPEEFLKIQGNCQSLTKFHERARDKIVTSNSHGEVRFFYNYGLLYREFISSSGRNNKITALVVPSICRQCVLETSHEAPLSGHFSFRKTELKVRTDFWWPGMNGEIKSFCRSCDLCQKLNLRSVKRVPMMKVPIIAEPFHRVSIDLVGPLSPASTGGHKYILTLIDIATSFPEAIPLKNIDSISVGEALLTIFSRVGIPKEIHSDLGTQFTSDLMQELQRLLGVHPIFNTPYHPMSTGRIERMHSTLKGVLRKLCQLKPDEWHRYLTPTLFALRELPSDRTGYSAFELLYGRKVRGPTAVLRDLWENPNILSDNRTIYQYLIELRERLTEGASVAAKQAELSRDKYKTYFDLKSQDRKLEVGEEALILLPDSSHKLLMSWKGPFKVLERRNRVNYLISEDGKPKLYHINLLKKYCRRNNNINIENATGEIPAGVPIPNLEFAQSSVISDQRESPEESEVVTLYSGESENIDICLKLSDRERYDLEELIGQFSSIFSNIPGCTDVISHKIRVNTLNPVRSKIYPIPLNLKQDFEKEVDTLLEQKIIQPSSSPYCSPPILVTKPEGGKRMAVDYRSVNSVTEFDAEPAPRLEEELHRFGSAKYFSQLDLCKAYYQVKMDPESIKYTAFPTHRGLMEFVRMPFGLVTACSTYMKLMRKVFGDLPNVSFYFDNILIFSDTWAHHLQILCQVFTRLKYYGLTVKPSKCTFGYESVEYLGFEIGKGSLKPLVNKSEAISNMPVPKTKSQVRSFLGTCQFYSKFIANFSTITAPLSNLLRKEVREPLELNPDGVKSFETLKELLTSAPILRLPDINRPFVLRTDASAVGVGGVLLQYHDSIPHPVAYGSRKLMPRETRYSTVERELLGVMFAINRFKYYLLGKSFILEVDHRPLVYLKRFKGENPRLMRWALSLQAFDFHIVYIAGKDNVGADLLSRSFEVG